MIWLAVSFSAGIFGSRFMPGQWYASLAKPSWNPPSWVFGPVWTALYIMMGIAAWLVWRRASGTERYIAIGLFLVQMVLNGMWTWLFFELRRPGLAFAEIVLLLFMILLTTAAFWRVRALAGIMMTPYILWVAFASALNYQLWRLNS